MKKIYVGLMVLVAVVLATGTILEHLNPEVHIYGQWWFVVLMAMVAIGALVAALQGKMWKRPPTLFIHVAVAVILLGGALTTWTGQHGSITLQPGVENNEFDGHILPFSITLESFEVISYPGTHTPMDFVSHVVVEGKSFDISMNKILRYRGYRFYQEDYGDEGSSTLSVAHDPYGICVTYCGYALLIIGLLGLLITKNGPFRSLLSGATLVVCLLLPMVASASPRTLPRHTAEQMGRMYVLYKGRVCPLQTYAKDFTTKLTGEATYKGLTSEQVLAGYLYFFDEWANEPLIKIKGDNARQQLSIDGTHASYYDFFGNEDKFLTDNKYDKSLLVASEKYGLIQSLLSGKGLKIFPLADNTGAISWYSQNDMLPVDIDDDTYIFVRKQQSYCQELIEKGNYEELEHVFEKTLAFQERQASEVLPVSVRVRAERLYNALTTGRWYAMLSISLGLLFFAISLFLTGKERKFPRWARWMAMAWVVLQVFFLLLIFILRWIIGGHAPMAGGFDSMNLMALVIGVVTLLLNRRNSTILPSGMMTMGFCLLVAMMSGSNPPVTNLMPVLNSPLLTLHVAVIMSSYALFFFVMMGSVAGLISNGEVYRRLNLLLLYPAVTLLAIGIIIGAVWANISWGNYWSWDPKEVWALIALIVYSITLHQGVLKRNRTFHLYCLLAFLSVVITYFGVNLFLGGMHAYN